MIKSLRLALVQVIASLTLILVPMAIPVAVHAQNPQGSASCGANIQIDQTNCTTTSTAGTSVSSIIKTIIDIFSAIVGAVSVIMIIIGGFRYITSGGESGSVSGAKNTIIYAIIGLVIVVLAQLIVQFVLSKTSTAING